MLTHMIIGLNLEIAYIYQPKGLNPETGEPVEKIFVHESRIKEGKYEELEVPIYLLNTKAEDIATEFKGTIIELICHLNGCFHVNVKPEGISNKTGNTLTAHEFDIRRMKGDAIKTLNKKEIKESIKQTPSPISFVRKL